MPRAKKVVQQHIKNGRTIKSLAAEYGVSTASTSNWIRDYRKECQSNDEEKTQLELMEEVRKLRLGKAFNAQSMSRAGTPYDNAPMERYYSTLKAEEVYQHRYDTVEELDSAINYFAYAWYNQIRPHSSNGYLTPMEKRFGVK